ncbi:glycosyltransferase [Luminiphilus sp.]|nr:glycosyltransferase [Luminiphilus sp.]
MTLYIVLPIYDEEKNLAALFEAIAASCREMSVAYLIVAVDDGSQDGSSALLEHLSESYPLHLITHKMNRGLGETIRDGLEAAADLSSPNDIIVRLDADCSHEPRYIRLLVGAIYEGADIAIASRFPNGGGQEGLTSDRKWLSKIANLVFRVCFPLKGLREYTCGYRAYRASLVKRALEVYGGDFLQLRGLGFCCTLEKLLKLQLLGAKIAEVPFVLRYDLKLSKSKMVFNVTVMGYVIMVILYHWPFGGWKASIRGRLKVT